MASGEIVRALTGILVFAAIAWLASEQRRKFPVKLLLIGLACQFLLALFLTRLPAVTTFFGWIARGAHHVQSSAESGARFVFGYLGGGAQPFMAADPVASSVIFAFQVLPAVIFVSALSALLWHWHVLRWFVRGAAWLFGRLFGISGPVGVSTAACMFIGMIEAPLLIRPVLPRLSRGEIFIIMVNGMSVLAGSMMIVLGAMLAPRVTDAFSHLLIAAMISTPMAICLARAMIPTDSTVLSEPLVLDNHYRSSLDALASGALIALKMAGNIIALLIVFVGLVALLDQMLALLPYSDRPLTLAGILGHVFSPVAWLMGVPGADLREVGALLGTKLALNEIVAYGNMMALPEGSLSDKSTLIATYALSSFGNVGSIAILIGTLTTMAPEKSNEIVQLGFRALLAATLTTCLTATCVGILASLPL